MVGGNCEPQILSLKSLHCVNLIGLFRSISYRRVNSNIQQQIRNDFKDIEGNRKILVKVDKSGNI